MIENMAVVVPAYNEGSIIASVLHQLEEHFKIIIAIDDGSTDNTWEEINSTSAISLKHLINIGQGGSIRTGFDFALKTGVDYIGTFDADGQHRIKDLLQMYQHISKHPDLDILLGSRFLSEDGAQDISKERKLLLKLATAMSRIMHNLDITDTHNGLRVFSRKAVEVMHLTTYGMAHASEILAEISANKLNYQEYPVKIKYTKYSVEKGQSGFNSLRILYDLFIGRKI